MISYCITNLNELRDLLEKMNRDQYTQSLKLLSGATIGQHFRNILESYQCVARGLNEGAISYEVTG